MHSYSNDADEDAEVDDKPHCPASVIFNGYPDQWLCHDKDQIYLLWSTKGALNGSARELTGRWGSALLGSGIRTNIGTCSYDEPCE
jgi:hypothetical protein